MPVTPAESVTCGRDNRVTLSATPPMRRALVLAVSSLTDGMEGSDVGYRSPQEPPHLRRQVWTSAGLWKAWSTMPGQASRLRKIDAALAMRVGPSRAAIIFEVAMDYSQFTRRPHRPVVLHVSRQLSLRLAPPIPHLEWRP
jgi:hypothetical protein